MAETSAGSQSIKCIQVTLLLTTYSSYVNDNSLVAVPDCSVSRTLHSELTTHRALCNREQEADSLQEVHSKSPMPFRSSQLSHGDAQFTPNKATKLTA